MFSANTDFQTRANLSTLLDRHLDELADTICIKRHEGVVLQDSLAYVIGDKASNVVAGVTEGHLREIVGAKRKELGLLRDFVGRQRRSRNFDHGADLVIARFSFFFKDL